MRKRANYPLGKTIHIKKDTVSLLSKARGIYLLKYSNSKVPKDVSHTDDAVVNEALNYYIAKFDRKIKGEME